MSRTSHNLKPALDMALKEHEFGLEWSKAVDKASQRYGLGPMDQDWLMGQKPKTSPSKPGKMKP